MNFLLDTQVFLAISRRNLAAAHPKLQHAIFAEGVVQSVSVATFWEISIKVRLGKLDAGVSLDDLGAFSRRMGLAVLPISEAHATVSLAVQPPTNDPFDRLLLAVAQVEGLMFVTADRALATLPLAYKP